MEELRKKRIYEAVRKTRTKQKMEKEEEIQRLSQIRRKVDELVKGIRDKETNFPRLPTFIGASVNDEAADRRNKSRQKRSKATTPEEKLIRAKLQNTESQQRRIARQKILDLNRKGEIIFLERQVKYLEEIDKITRDCTRRATKTAQMELLVLTRLLFVPKYQTPPSFLFKKKQTRNYRKRSNRHD
jgi:hypothetical protein